MTSRLTGLPDNCISVHPQSINRVAAADNIFALSGSTQFPKDLVRPPPPSDAKYAMAIMMIIHQFIAFALYGTSLMFIWEKLWRVHHRPWYIRIPVRVPLSELTTT